MTTTTTDRLDQAILHTEIELESATSSVLQETATLRRVLDRIEANVADGNSTYGETADGRRLNEALLRRDTLARNLTQLRWVAAQEG